MPRFRVGPQDYAIHTGRSWRIRNLSLSGAFIEDREPLEPGRTIYLELHLGQERIPCQGIVRRSVPREGMGVQFESIEPEARDRLERYLNTLEKAMVSTPSAVPAAPPAPEEAAPGQAVSPLSTADEALSARLHNLGAELRALEEEIKAGQVDARVLQEFRESVDQIRVTAWAVQQWTELQAQKGDAYSVLPLLTKERIRRATQLAETLNLDIDASEITFETEGIEKLHRAIEGVHYRLARLFKK
jgi:hypothetical protein